MKHQSEPLLLTVPEAAAQLRIGRTLAYQLAKRGELPTVRLGAKLLVPRSELERYITSRVKEAS